jgi:TetR/AcrR family transcriptional regulator, mexCD-oprJ operon repressor
MPIRSSKPTGKEEVIAAATIAITEQCGRTMNQIAASVGISRATLHRLFNSRSALEIAVAEFSIANLEQATQGVISTGATGKIAVDRLMEVALPIAPSLGFLALKSSATIDPIHQTTTDAIYQVWESWCVEGQRRGEIRLDVPSRWAVRAIPLVSWGIFAAVRRGEVAATDARHLLRTTIFEGVLGQAPPKSVTLHLPTKETSSKDTDPLDPLYVTFQHPALQWQESDLRATTIWPVWL